MNRKYSRLTFIQNYEARNFICLIILNSVPPPPLLRKKKKGGVQKTTCNLNATQWVATQIALNKLYKKLNVYMKQ